MTFATGHIADHPVTVARRTGLHLAPFQKTLKAAAALLPSQTMNRANLSTTNGGPGLLDQQNLGACEGFAHASAGTLYLANQGQSAGLISPIMLYLGALLQDQTLQLDGTLSQVTDTGTMPSSILAAWLSFGALLAKDDPNYPASQSTLYQNPTDPNSTLKLPPIEEFYKSSPYRYQGAYFITSGGPKRILDALSVMAAGRTITDAIPASGQDFQGYSGGILGALSGPIDHANHIADYEWVGSTADWQSFQTALRNGDTTTVTSLSQYLIFHCINSWGEVWGEADPVAGTAGGCYRAGTNYFFQAEDLCVVDLRAA